MESRMDMCAAKGFDAIESDNMDGYANKIGFPLTYADQLHYNKWLANEAHERRLSIAMKNNEARVRDLLPYYDFAITEDCFDGQWCGKLSPFVEQDKAVLAAKYTDTGMTRQKFCPKAGTLLEKLLRRVLGLVLRPGRTLLLTALAAALAALHGILGLFLQLVHSDFLPPSQSLGNTGVLIPREGGSETIRRSRGSVPGRAMILALRQGGGTDRPQARVIGEGCRLEAATCTPW